MEPTLLEEHSSEEEHFSEDQEDYSSEEFSSPEAPPAPPRPTNPLNVGFALVAAFAIGLALGFLGRPQIISDVPIQVVVTVVSENSSETVAQVPTSASQSANNANPDQSTGSLSEANPTASQPEQQSSDSAQATPTIMDFVMADARHIDGDMDAPVTIIEFSDFKWPYCGRFVVDSLSQIRTTYVDTGKVRFVYKHFAILGPESSRSAEASECAAEQDKFWEYHDLIFDDQNTSRSTLDQETLTGLASEIGLDTTAFSECLASGKYSLQISRESQAVQALGVRGTPGFLVNGLFVSGAQPFEVFQQIIEEQLAATAAN